MFKGLCTAIVTPFKNNGKSVDYDAFKRLVDFQIENGAKAIVFFGTTGEAATLTKKEKIEIAKFAVSYVNKRIKVIVGSGSNNTAEAVKNAKLYTKLGVDGLLVVTPYYNKCTQSGLIEHYTKIARSTNLPIIMYNVPGRTGVNIAPETTIKLSKIKNIVAIKEASGNLTQVQQILSHVDDDFSIFSGDDGLLLPMLSVGAKGVISVASNIMPKEVSDICNFYFNKNTTKAKELQLKLHELFQNLFIEVNPIPVKNAMEMLGMIDATTRLPLTSQMKEENYKKLKNTLISLKLALKKPKI